MRKIQRKRGQGARKGRKGDAVNKSEEMKEGEMNYSLLLESIILQITAPLCYRSFSFPLPSRKGDRCKEYSLKIYKAPRQTREQRERDVGIILTVPEESEGRVKANGTKTKRG